MYKAILSTFLLSALTLVLHAETNSTVRKTKEHNTTVVLFKKDHNSTKSEREKRIKEQIEAQMKKEQKYAKEMIFYQGDDYNLSEHEIDPNNLPDVPLIEPDYDFSMDDVYRDDI